MTKALDISFPEAAEDNGGSTGRALSISNLDTIVAQSVLKARAAFASTRNKSLNERLQVIRRFRITLANNATSFARDLSVEANRSPQEFLASEIIPLLDACRFLEKNAAKILRPRTHRFMPLWLFGTRHEIIREPLGVVLIIGASNYPLFLPAVQVLQALVAGNSVLLKPAPAAIDCAQALSDLLLAAGLNQDHLQVLPAAPEAASYAIGRQMDKVFLTGSIETGRKVLIHAATAVTPAVVELSGCDGVFVLPDADLDLAAECIAFGLTLNSGNTCIAPRRAFVWKEVHASLIEKLRAALARRPKTFTRATARSGPLVNLFEAISAGASLVNGAASKNGIIEGPLVVANLRSDTPFATAENWGPNLSLISVANEAEAVSAYEKSAFALGASIFSRSTQSAHRLARSIRAGSICINDLIVPTADGRLPFGGRKQSGFGATRGPEGLLEMTAPKVISVRSPKSHFHLRPATEGQLDMLAAYSASAYSSGYKRIDGTAKLLRAVIRSSPKSTKTDHSL